jgi:hypothetical protein
MSTLNLTDSFIPMSIQLLTAVSNHVNSTGYLTQVVNPNRFDQQGDSSPEGQSFVILAYAAYRDWVNLGRKNGPGNGSDELGGYSAAARALDSDFFGWAGTCLALASALVGSLAML